MVTTSERGLFSRAALTLLLQLIAYLQTASSVLFDVKDEHNQSCILADLAVNFSVSYKDTNNILRIASFELPPDASLLKNSSCGTGNASSAPLLQIGFRNGYVMSMNFTKDSAKYQVDKLSFSYNMSDTAFFHNASERELKTVTSQKSGIEANVNTTYKCTNENNIHMENVNATFHDIRIQAYLSTSNFSVQETQCSEDTTPTVPPTTTTTTPPPPPVPTPTSPPKSGRYQVNNTNGTCILAEMGLQINIIYLNATDKNNTLLFNVDPQNVTVSGNCNANLSILMLHFEKTSLTFMFGKNESAQKFYLADVDINTTLPSDAKVKSYLATNNSIMYLQTSLGKSYMCKTMQVLRITDTFSINAFSLHVQAFKFDANSFGTAEECKMDEDNILVPIIVGAALAGLVLIVLIAYLIGRKRSHAGYQTI